VEEVQVQEIVYQTPDLEDLEGDLEPLVPGQHFRVVESQDKAIMVGKVQILSLSNLEVEEDIYKLENVEMILLIVHRVMEMVD
jgi:hypothetical protein